jgi:DNA-binding beta-propeller fold protein YncE
MGVAMSRDAKRLYVTDYAKPGVFVVDVETRRMSPFGTGGQGFKSPLGVAVDDQDRVYVVDSTARMVRVFDASGALLRNITDERVERPTGIAVDATRRRVYIADSASKTSDNHVVRVFDTDGAYVTAIGAAGNGQGQFAFPSYLAVDGRGNLYVSDTMNGRVQVFDPDGRYVKTIGQRGDAFGMFDKPKGVALDSFGNVYVVDSSWSNVQIFNEQGQVLLFFGGRGRYPGLLFNPTGIAIDRNNQIYVADAFNGRVVIYGLVNTKAEDSAASVPSRPGKGGDSSKAGSGHAAPAAQATSTSKR